MKLPPVRGLPPDLAHGEEHFTRWELARALHVTAPHGNLHPWDNCPQRDHDEQDSDNIIAAMHGFRVSEAISE